MPKAQHYSLKCDYCLICIREGEEARRLGSMQITVWTPVGPYTLTLCGECAKPVRKAAEILDEVLNEKPE